MNPRGDLNTQWSGVSKYYYMVTLEDYKKLPQEHYCDFRGRRWQVKDIVKYLEEEHKRTDELLARLKEDKKKTDIK